MPSDTASGEALRYLGSEINAFYTCQVSEISKIEAPK